MTVTHRDVLFAALVWSPVILAWLADVASGGAVSGAARGAFDHGRAQAASEVRRARQAVADNTRASLRKRIADGKARGPKSAIWWGAAAVMAARKAHRSMKGLRDGATGKWSPSLPSAGPWRRIFDAGVAGAGVRYRQARTAAKARRSHRPGMRDRVRRGRWYATRWAHPGWAHRWNGTGHAATGVCDRCGVTTAVLALAYEGPWLLCYACRAPAVPDDTGTAGALPAGAGGAEGDGVAYGELVPELALAGATTEGEIMAKSDKELLARAHPADLRELAKRELDRGNLEASRAYLDHAKQVEQAIREMQPVGRVLARRTAQPAHRALGHGQGAIAGGDITTHGDWDRKTQQVMEALRLITRRQEAMLGSLRAADAGRTQMADIRAWSDRVTAAVAHVQRMLDETNARIYPLIDAVNAAGGPCEVASPAYHSDF